MVGKIVYSVAKPSLLKGSLRDASTHNPQQMFKMKQAFYKKIKTHNSQNSV